MNKPSFTLKPEPNRASFSNVITLYFSATRPAFLLATLAACLLGLAGAGCSGVHITPSTAAMTLLLALLVHAAVNVLNDYFDDLNGTDACNTQRLYPFTGGSRFIQNNILSAAQTLHFGYVLMAVAMLGGLWLSWQVGSGLLLIGFLGMLIGWAYSASPLRLNARGLGELCVLLGFLGIIIGADFVQRQSFSLQPVMVGMPYALLATNLLYINQYPDRLADATAGKRNLVVRLAPAVSVWIYLALIVLVVFWLAVMITLSVLPILALAASLPLMLSWQAFRILRLYATQPDRLLPAIKLSLASMLSHALLLGIILFWNTP